MLEKQEEIFEINEPYWWMVTDGYELLRIGPVKGLGWEPSENVGVGDNLVEIFSSPLFQLHIGLGKRFIKLLEKDLKDKEQ